jgi:hypothetical protein
VKEKMSENSPWESAANDATFRAATAGGEASTIISARESMDLDSTVQANVNASVAHWGQSFVKICAILDAGAAVFLASYMLYYQDHHHNNHDQYSVRVMYSAAMVLALRSLLEFTSTRCGLYLSGLISLILSLVYAILGLTVKLESKHGTFSNLFHLPLPDKYQHHAWWILLVSGLVECCRWALLQQYQTLRSQRSSASSYHNNPAGASTSGSASRASPRRRLPWWLSSSGAGAVDTSLQQSLLEENGNQPLWAQTSTRNGDYSLDDGVGTPRGRRKRGWWPFSSQRSPSGDDYRDDGSVEYASLNEEWATRSQQDPHWWSRDGDVSPQRATTNSSTTGQDNKTSPSAGANGVDTSWADNA